MSKKLIFPLLVSLIAIVLLFVGMLYLRNGTELVISMQDTKSAVLNPQLYYAKANTPFSESRSLKARALASDTYRFQLIHPEKMEKVRFDPTNRPDDITLKQITLIRNKWFKTDYTTIPLAALSPASQISDFAQTPKQIHFKTTGRDPQFSLALNPLHTETYTSLHLDLLLLSLIIWLLLLFIWELYKKSRGAEIPTAKLILYALFFALTIFKTVYYKDHIKFGYPPDELAHLSYIKYIHSHHDFVPDYSKMTMINNPHRGNYLSHPPLYYELLNSVYDGRNSAIGNVENFRRFSLLIFLLAFMLILYIGFKAELDILADFVFLTFLVSVPMYTYTGASISNDTLAFLGAAVFALGFVRLIDRDYSLTTYLLLSVGIGIAYFSKLTAALLIFFALLFFLVHMFTTRQWIRLDKRGVAVLTLVLLPILYYQLSIILQYHALVPTFNVTHPKQYLDSPFFVPEAYRQHLNPMQWFERMIHYIEGGWFGIHSHHSFTKSHWTGYLGLLLLHVFALLALLMPCPREKRAYCLLGKFTLTAVFAVLIVQYFFSYKAHLNSGYLGGLQPRYLLPFMFGFAIMASIFAERFKRWFWLIIAVILICIHAIYSDFFYFLQYYH